MLRQITNLFGQKPQHPWFVADCGGDSPSVRRGQGGDSILIGGDADWSLECGEDYAVLQSGSGRGMICFNGTWVGSGGPHKLLPGGEYTVVVPSGRGGLPLLICGGESTPAWAQNGSSPSLLLKQRGDHWDGPFRSLGDLRARLVRGQVPKDALFGVEGSANAFYLRDLWPEVIEEEEAVFVPASTTNAANGENEPLTVIEGKLVCPFCRQSFGMGDFLYFSPPDSPGRLDPPVAGKAHSYDVVKGVAHDKYGKVCVDRACPHCLQRLPKSFGTHAYTIFSLVGQSGSGKSYYLAALFHELPSILSRFGLGYLGDDAELNRDFELMSQIPYKQDPPINRHIPKTDNSQPTQIKVLLRGEGEERRIPKPITFKVGKGRTNVKHVTFYDNPGEHFTAVEAGALMTEVARIAASHLAFASSVFLLYDPILSVGFRSALGMDALTGERDEQSTMLNALPERMENERSREGGASEREIPLAVLVGKWDVWQSIAPDLSRDYLTPDHRLDLRVIRENSDRLRDLLDKHGSGVPAAANAISGDLVYFPVSSFGGVGVVDANFLGAVQHVPAAPVKPWAVEIPFLWALWRIHPELVPVVGEVVVDGIRRMDEK